ELVTIITRDLSPALLTSMGAAITLVAALGSGASGPLKVTANAFAAIAGSIAGFLEEHETVANVLGTVITTLIIAKGLLIAYGIVAGIAASATAAWGIAAGIAEGAARLFSIGMIALNLAMYANPIGLVVLAVVALIAIFVLAYN